MVRLKSPTMGDEDITKITDTLPVKRITTRLDANEYTETGLYIADMWTGVTRDGLNIPFKNPLALLVIRFDTLNAVQICIPRDLNASSIMGRRLTNSPDSTTEWKKIGG